MLSRGEGLEPVGESVVQALSAAQKRYKLLLKVPAAGGEGRAPELCAQGLGRRCAVAGAVWTQMRQAGRRGWARQRVRVGALRDVGGAQSGVAAGRGRLPRRSGGAVARRRGPRALGRRQCRAHNAAGGTEARGAAGCLCDTAPRCGAASRRYRTASMCF
jgi:hypothetical protein